MVTKKKIVAKDYFNDFFLRGWKIFPTDVFDVEYVDPHVFLDKYRFDLPFKIFYVESYVKNNNLELAEKLYKESIYRLSNGKFYEPGNSDKNSYDKYLDSFKMLINDIKKNGFDINKSVIPVGNHGEIINGSHRVAICIYFNIPVPIVRVNEDYSFDYNFFKRRKMSQYYLDYGARLFTKYSSNSYLAFVWPKAFSSKNIDCSLSLLEQSNNVIYKKAVNISYLGLKQVAIAFYCNQSWTGGIQNKFCKIMSLVNSRCYKRVEPVVYLITSNSLKEITALKQYFRIIAGIQNESIHITDTNEEAVEAAEILFNEKAISSINHYDFLDNKQYFNLILSNFNSGRERNNHLLNDMGFYYLGTYIDVTNLPASTSAQLRTCRQRKAVFKNTIFAKAIKKLLTKSRLFFSVHKFSSISSFIKFLNRKYNYVIISHWTREDFNKLSFANIDIDVLVKDVTEYDKLQKWCKVKNRHKIMIEKRICNIDIYYIGCGYYDEKWEQAMFSNRIKFNNTFVLSDLDFYYSLLYHAKYHSHRNLTYNDYLRLKSAKFIDNCTQLELFDDLHKFLKENTYAEN